jgi:glycyl-tRNA synthetase alpha chain
VTLQELIAALDGSWAAQGCVVAPAYDLKVGTGRMHPIASFRSLGPRPWRVAHLQPARRPAGGRCGQNPGQMQRSYQYEGQESAQA